MEFRTFTATENDDSRRLDKILRRLLPGQNLSGIYKILRKNLVKVNGKKEKAEYQVKNGDEIKIAAFLFENDAQIFSENENTCEKTENKISGEILNPVFHNENIFIINKPYGITVHGKENSLDRLVKDLYEKSGTTSLSFAPGPLHRLDERTTGLLCFSWSLKGARWFSENIKNHSIKKEYLAIVEGKMTENQKWKDFIDSENKTSEKNSFKKVSVKEKITSGTGENYKKALTEAFPLAYGNYNGTPFTLVIFLIRTGRTHQIRSQSASHGFPLIGDTAYGGKKIDSGHFERELFLHAWRLSIPENPVGLPEIIKCSPDKNFLKFLQTGNCETENLSL